MEVSASLLVAIMFVTILGMGIANLLVGLASMVDRRTRLKPFGVHTGWVILLLLIYLNQFWNLLSIFAIEPWKFFDFLLAVSGPVVLFFAASVILPQAANEHAHDMRAHYFTISKQFFWFLALIQILAIAVHLLLLNNLRIMNAVHAVFLAFFLALGASQKERFHQAGLGIGWALFVIVSALQGAELI